jgi:acylphosphatase
MHSENVSHKNIRISGRVQGVGFRYAARNRASLAGIQGFVKNLSNGAVYIEAEGSREQVDEFIAWCRQGPPRARVEYVDITEGEVVGFGEFFIK